MAIRAAAVCVALLAAAVLAVPLPGPIFPERYGTVVLAANGDLSTFEVELALYCSGSFHARSCRHSVPRYLSVTWSA